MKENKSKKEQNREEKRNLLKVSTLGIDLVLLSGLGLFGGLKLDNWFSTKPVLTILLFCIGLAAGFLNIIRTMKKINDAEK